MTWNTFIDIKATSGSPDRRELIIMHIIDLISSQGDDIPENELVCTSRESRKATKRILDMNPDNRFLRQDVVRVVENYCQEHPNDRDISIIAQNCQILLINKSQISSSSSARRASHVDPSLLVQAIDSSQEVKILGTKSPLEEVLRVLPQASRKEVERLLIQNHGDVNATVHHMLQHGFETQAPKQTSAEEPTHAAKDYTVNTWPTSAVYQKEAVEELGRNYPFLTLPSLRNLFQHHKMHFYHCVKAIEEHLGIKALRFCLNKIQHIVAPVASSSGGDGSGSGNGNGTTPPTGSSSGSGIGGSSGGSKSAGARAAAKKKNLYRLPCVEQQKLKNKIAAAFPKGMLTLKQNVNKYYVYDEIANGSAHNPMHSRGSTTNGSGGVDGNASTTSTTSTASSTASSTAGIIAAAPTALTDPVLIEEIVWMYQQARLELEQSDKLAAEQLNEQMAEAEGNLIECGCCYGEYAFESIIQCTEGHLFCKGCLQRYAEASVFGNGRATLTCMNTTEACTGFFPDNMLKISLPEKVFAKYSEAQARDVLESAKIDGLVTCHGCQLQVLLDPTAGNVLLCPECGKETCRLCGEVSHIPLKCSEVEKKSDTNRRRKVEEAMTEARLRECLKCKTRFFKTEGCNKMACRCGAHICYVCKKDISKEGYKHFCQTPHCNHKSCNKCKLYSDAVEDDRKAMLEAGMAAGGSAGEGNEADVAGAESEEGVGDNGKKIDVQQLLEKSDPNRRIPGVPRMPAAGAAAAAAAAAGVGVGVGARQPPRYGGAFRLPAPAPAPPLPFPMPMHPPPPPPAVHPAQVAAGRYGGNAMAGAGAGNRNANPRVNVNPFAAGVGALGAAAAGASRNANPRVNVNPFAAGGPPPAAVAVDARRTRRDVGAPRGGGVMKANNVDNNYYNPNYAGYDPNIGFVHRTAAAHRGFDPAAHRILPVAAGAGAAAVAPEVINLNDLTPRTRHRRRAQQLEEDPEELDYLEQRRQVRRRY